MSEPRYNKGDIVRIKGTTDPEIAPYLFSLVSIKSSIYREGSGWWYQSYEYMFDLKEDWLEGFEVWIKKWFSIKRPSIDLML